MENFSSREVFCFHRVVFDVNILTQSFRLNFRRVLRSKVEII